MPTSPPTIGPYQLDKQFHAPSWPGALWWGHHTSKAEDILLASVSQHPISPAKMTIFLLESLPQLNTQRHPNMLHPIECIEHNDQLWFCYRNAPRPPNKQPATLDDALQHNQYSEEQLLSLFHGVLEAIEQLHASRIWHGLLSPVCLLFDWSQDAPSLRLGMLGLAQLYEHLNQQPGPWTPYQPPAMYQSAEPDKYALGAIAWHLLTGTLPPATPPFDNDRFLWSQAHEHTFDQSVIDFFRVTLGAKRAEEAPTWVTRTLGLTQQDTIEVMSPSAHRPLQDWGMADKKTLPYDFLLSEALAHLEAANHATDSPAATPHHAFLEDGDDKASQPELFSTHHTMLPAPIPERWEQEALKQDEWLDKQQQKPKWIGLLLLLGLALLAWLTR
jgi:serine/threonine protein kinase